MLTEVAGCPLFGILTFSGKELGHSAKEQGAACSFGSGSEATTEDEGGVHPALALTQPLTQGGAVFRGVSMALGSTRRGSE